MKARNAGYWDIVCPTCHAVNDVRWVRSAANAWRLAIAILVVLVIGWPVWKFEYLCAQCGARFRPRRVGKDLVCSGCGYNLRGLTCPRCPECGCDFPEWLLERLAEPVGNATNAGRK